MRDLNLNEFSASLREALRDKGVEIPLSLVYQMTKAFFRHAEKVAQKGNEKFYLHGRNLSQVYPVWDVERLCGELAAGDNVLTADMLLRKNKLEKKARRHYRKMYLRYDKAA